MRCPAPLRLRGVIPIVVAPILFAWIAMAFYADRHPGRAVAAGPPTERSPGIFHGEGRQMMPRRDTPPEETASVGQGARDGKR